MLVGERIRDLREAKRLSQGDIEHRTGLIRCYTSRVENGHTVPSLETLEKYARALEVPLYYLFYQGGDKPPEPPKWAKPKQSEDRLWGSSGREARQLALFRRYLSRMSERNRNLLMAAALRMASRKAHHQGSGFAKSCTAAASITNSAVSSQ